MSHLCKIAFRKSANLCSRLHILKSKERTFSTTKMIFAEYQTVDEIRKNLALMLDYVEYQQKQNQQNLPKSQTDLPVRKMKDSLDSAIVPLKTNLTLREKYTTYHGEVRIGRLMEDIDIFAAWCCVKHILGPGAGTNAPFPYVIVTIRVDNIDFTRNADNQKASGRRGWDEDHLFNSVEDIRLTGHVSWVGQTSLEVIVWVEQEVEGKWKEITKAFLLMAVRNATNSGPAIVNAIEPESPEEEQLIKGGGSRKEKRMKMMNDSLLKKVPTEEELSLVHKLFLKTMDSNSVFLDQRILPPQSKWMHDATTNNLVFCHPEHRNLHNKVFGGFMIRQALELSWIAAYTYGMMFPRLIHISDIGFYHPVDVGSLLGLHASVTYAEKEYIQVFVYADAFSLGKSVGENKTTFNFTYKLSDRVDALYPQTYLEAMRYIDGRRHFFEVKKHNRELGM